VLPSTPVRRRAGLRLWTEDARDEVRVVLLDRTVRLAGASAEAVKVLLDGAVHSAADLPGSDEATPADGPDAAVSVAVSLVRRLLREGVLVPA
jgi:hypothetical protein